LYECFALGHVLSAAGVSLMESSSKLANRKLVGRCRAHKCTSIVVFRSKPLLDTTLALNALIIILIVTDSHY
jgi:hypothetical protein